MQLTAAFGATGVTKLVGKLSDKQLQYVHSRCVNSDIKRELLRELRTTNDDVYAYSGKA
jgi:hypothetical protein